MGYLDLGGGLGVDYRRIAEPPPTTARTIRGRILQAMSSRHHDRARRTMSRTRC